MRILIVSQYFWPEVFVITDLAKVLAEQGHIITVATGKPNYPFGTIAPRYSESGVEREIFEGNVEVIRVPLRPRGNATALALALNYLSFIVSATLRLPYVLRGRHFDLVLFFGVSPITSALPAILMKRIKKAHFAIWVQDLWPESLTAAGFIKNRLVLSCMAMVVNAIYRAADTLLLQSRAFFASVSVRAEPHKLVFFPNIAPDIQRKSEKEFPVELSEMLRGVFSVVYTGNLGRAQSLATIAEAAQHLKEHTQIRFFIFGTGSEAASFAELITKQKLTNINLAGFVPQSLMPPLLDKADALLVTLRDDPALALTIPSKIQAYMQAGRPIVASLNGESAHIILEAGAGLVSPAEDGAALAKSILALYSMPKAEQESLGTAGRQYFEKHFEAHRSARRLIEILQARMEASH